MIWVFPIIPCSAQQYHWRRAYIPQNNSDPWESIAFNPLSNGRVIFAGPRFVGGVFRSDDGGFTWVEHDSLLDPVGLPMNEIHQIFCLPSDTNIVLAVTAQRCYRSTNGGITWNDIYNNGSLTDLGGMDGESIGYNTEEDALYYGEPLTGVMRSVDHGADWTQFGTASDSILLNSMDVSQGPSPQLIQNSELSSGWLFAHSTDRGNTWSVSLDGGSNAAEGPKIVFSWKALNPVTGEPTVAIIQRWPTTDSSLLATTDAGDTWQNLNNAPVRTWGLDIDQRASMLSKPGDPAYPRPLHFFTGFFNVDQDTIPNGMIQETTDGGISWHSTNFPKGVAGNSLNPPVREIWVLKYDTLSGQIAVAADSGIYIGDASNGIVEEQPTAPQIQLTQSEGFVTLSSRMPIEIIHLFDITGRQIMESKPQRNIFSLSLKAFPSGIYGVEAIIEGQLPFRKILAW